MIPVLVEGPALEPVSLAEAKAWLRLDSPEDDDLVQALIVSARLVVEAEIGRVLIAQEWRLVADRWPGGGLIPVRLGHVLAVHGARVFSASGVAQALPGNDFIVRNLGETSEVHATLTPAPGRLHGGIEIDLRLGFGEAASDVPQPIRVAMRRLIALWYADRGDVPDEETALPAQIRALLRPYRRVRL